jgi:hypothetical protein
VWGLWCSAELVDGGAVEDLEDVVAAFVPFELFLTSVVRTMVKGSGLAVKRLSFPGLVWRSFMAWASLSAAKSW